MMVELNEKDLENVNGGFVGWEWDIDTLHGTCGLGSNRNYEFTDKVAFERVLSETEGMSDIARIQELLKQNVIKKIG